MKMLGWGMVPPKEEFFAAFKEHCPEGFYIISHGALSRSSDSRPPEATYNVTALWYELERLRYLGDDEALGWVSNILGTLGWEWV